MIRGKWKILIAAVAVCCFLNFVSAQSARSVSRKLQSKKSNQKNRKSAGKSFKSRSRKCSGRKARTGSKSITKKSTNNSRKSTATEDKTGGLKKAGEFNGDLRDLPKTKPPDQVQPRPGEPPDKPIPAPTPVKKPPGS